MNALSIKKSKIFRGLELVLISIQTEINPGIIDIFYTILSYI